MAHNPAHRRPLPSSQPQPSSSMDPTLSKKKSSTKSLSNHQTPHNHHQLIPSKPNFYMSNPLSKLNPPHKTHPPPPLAYLDTHLQAKAISVSADFDSSCRASLLKSKHHHQQVKRIESKDKVKRVSSDIDEKKVEKFVNISNNNNKFGVGKEGKEPIEGLLDIKRMTVSLNGVGCGRRRSLCGPEVELADFLANNGAKIVSVDMPPLMQIHAVDCARKTHDSLEKFTSKTLALTLKKEFDGVYGPAWHCIVGKSFGSFVTHSVGGFLYFSMDQKLN